MKKRSVYPKVQIYLKQRNKDDARKYPNWRESLPECFAHSSLICFQSAKRAFAVPVKKRAGERGWGKREDFYHAPC